MEQESFNDRAERIRKQAAERHAQADELAAQKITLDKATRETARAKAQKYIEQAEELVGRGLPTDAGWITAYSTLALATLALVGIPGSPILPASDPSGLL
jgi:hypothetical protein